MFFLEIHSQLVRTNNANSFSRYTLKNIDFLLGNTLFDLFIFDIPYSFPKNIFLYFYLIIQF